MVEKEDHLKIEGRFSGTIRAQTMFLDTEMHINFGKNIVVNNGLVLALQRLAGVSANPITHMALGTSGTAESATQTTLGTETIRKSATINVDSGNYKVTAQATFSGNDATGTQELGIFNSSSAGTMFARKVISPALSLPSGFNIVITWSATLGRP
mgnify:CR=1 FL=1